MIVLHIVPGLEAAGAELMLKRLVCHKARGLHIEHHVISLGTIGSVGRDIAKAGVRVEALGMLGAASFPAAVVRLRARIRAIRPDIIQSWMYHSDLIGGLAARLAGHKNIVWGVRSTHLLAGEATARLTGVVRRICARLSTWIPRRILYVAHSARTVHEAIGYDTSKSIVIPNGYVVPALRPNEEERGHLRKALGLSKEAVLVGTAGRFNALKDFPTFVAAAGILASRDPNVHFVMMGREIVPDNPQLFRWIAKTGHQGRFHLLGEQANLEERLRGLDIFTLHSISEGFPNVVAEAMAVGIPCAVTDAGDAAFVVGDTGVVVKPGDPPALADALGLLVSEGPEERVRRGARALRRIASEFAIDEVAARYSALYEQLTTPSEVRHRPADPLNLSTGERT